MHVLMTGDAIGGVWQYATDLAQGLRAQGVRVTLAILGPAPSSNQMAAAAGIDVVLVDHPLDWTAPAPADVIEAGAALARLADASRADIVHLHSPALAAASAFATPVVAVCHSCLATWWDACGSGPLPRDLQWRRDLAEEGCRRADALLAPTATFAACTANAYGLVQTPTVVYNGRRTTNAALPRRQAVDRVFTSGRLWDKAKNAAGIDRVAARLSVPVRAAGSTSGPNGEDIQLRHLQLLGHLDDASLAGELARQPVFLSLALYEPFGLAVLEAAQAGCALVLADIPTFRELWHDAALFVDPRDDVATAAAIDVLLEDQDARAVLGAAARSRAGSYDVAAMTDGVHAVFRRLLAPTVAIGDAA